MNNFRKLFCALICLGIGFSPLMAADQIPQRGPLGKIYECRSEIADTALVLSAIWLGIAAVGSYRLTKVPEKTLPTLIKWALDYTQPVINLEQAVQLEMTALGCIGGSLSAWTLLLLKKLSWEKKAAAHS